jgi:hypothetical protein
LCDGSANVVGCCKKRTSTHRLVRQKPRQAFYPRADRTPFTGGCLGGFFFRFRNADILSHGKREKRRAIDAFPRMGPIIAV